MRRFSFLRWLAMAGLTVATIASAADEPVRSNSPGVTPAPATQPAGTSVPRADIGEVLRRVRERFDALKLSDEQKQKIDAAFAKTGQEMKAAAEELKDAARPERLKRFNELLQKLREQVRSVLTSEQIKQLPSEAQAGAASALSTTLARLREGLSQIDLSDEQKAEIEDLVKESREKINKIRGETGTATAEARDKMRSVGESLREKLLAALSPDQKQKLRELMEKPAATQPAGATKGAAAN